MSHRQILSVLLASTIGLLGSTTLLGCDEGLGAPPSAQDEFEEVDADTPAVRLAGLELRAQDVPWPEIELSAANELRPQHQTQRFGPWTIETFVFSSDPDFLSISTAPDVLFAPFPEGIASLPPEIDDGFLLGFQFRDTNDNIIGFGSELEVLDFETLTGETTYTLMINGRGSIAFTQQEDFAWLFGLLDEMAADQVLQREFEPPVVALSTIPGTARILGGSGEFSHAVGFAREFGIVHEIDLVTRVQRVSSVLQIAYLNY